MKSLCKVFFVLFVCFVVFSLPLGLNAQDDFGLPPPPDADEDLLPPPPGGDELGGGELPPPPGEGAGEELPPPPSEEVAGEELPPPAEEMTAEEELPPPPAEEELAPPPAEKETKKVASKSTSAGSKYTVISGDSLWKISGKSSIYGDSFQWPLLFKANRDIIEDPDLIYPKQKLSVKRNYTQAEIDDAIQKAKETPPYEPHTLPRKKLPIKY
ncbi:MAG: LysM peptidoglycan-binding domain-containing protein [Candidatus Goldbacteria bacterium]|nr:LysM peptidoglycan-binding domain-containing protein [Candidatus Goldiibacteriota bacterium]